jgi:hypothetical protein
MTIILEWILNPSRSSGQDLFLFSGYGPVTGSFENGNEVSSSIKGRKFFVS